MSAAPPVPVAIRVGAAVAVIVALVLCAWQVRRHGERNAGREAALLVADAPVLAAGEPVTDAAAWRRIRWEGRFDGAAHLEASRSDGRHTGYGVFQRFRRGDGTTVLVDRGWIPAEAAAERVATLGREAEPAVLEGQLRPLGGSAEATPVEGHGTRIWPPRTTAVLRLATGSDLPLYVVAGPVEGGRGRSEPPLDGFERVPARDDTSAHYAAQWLGIAVLAAIVATPGALGRIRQFVDA